MLRSIVTAISVYFYWTCVQKMDVSWFWSTWAKETDKDINIILTCAVAGVTWAWHLSFIIVRFTPCYSLDATVTMVTASQYTHSTSQIQTDISFFLPKHLIVKIHIFSGQITIHFEKEPNTVTKLYERAEGKCRQHKVPFFFYWSTVCKTNILQLGSFICSMNRWSVIVQRHKRAHIIPIYFPF